MTPSSREKVRMRVIKINLLDCSTKEAYQTRSPKMNLTMKNKISVLYGFLISSLLILTSCVMSETKFTSIWRDANYSGHVKDILVLGISERQGVRRLFETEVVNSLKEYGVNAIPGFTLFPSAEKITKETVVSEIEGMDLDGVLVTRVAGRRTEKIYVPSTDYREFSGFYRYGSAAVNSPGYSIEDEVVTVETNLFDAKTKQLIWSASSDSFTYRGGSSDDVIKQYIKMLINNLSKQDLLGKG